MILSVFSWFPFVGAYLQSFSRNLSIFMNLSYRNSWEYWYGQEHFAKFQYWSKIFIRIWHMEHHYFEEDLETPLCIDITLSTILEKFGQSRNWWLGWCTWMLVGISGCLVGSTAHPTLSRSCGRADHQNSILNFFRSPSHSLYWFRVIFSHFGNHSIEVFWRRNNQLALYGPIKLTHHMISLTLHVKKARSEKTSSLQSSLILTKCKVSLCSLLLQGAVKYFFADFVRKWSTPSPFMDKIFAER